MGGFPPFPHRELYARADGDGHFEIDGMPLGPSKVHVRHASFVQAVVDVTAAPADSATARTGTAMRIDMVRDTS